MKRPRRTLEVRASHFHALRGRPALRRAQETVQSSDVEQNASHFELDVADRVNVAGMLVIPRELERAIRALLDFESVLQQVQLSVVTLK